MRMAYWYASRFDRMKIFFYLLISYRCSFSWVHTLFPSALKISEIIDHPLSFRVTNWIAGWNLQFNRWFIQDWGASMTGEVHVEIESVLFRVASSLPPNTIRIIDAEKKRRRERNGGREFSVLFLSLFLSFSLSSSSLPIYKYIL